MKCSFNRLWRSVVVLLVSLQFGPVLLHADETSGGTLTLYGNPGSSGATTIGAGSVDFGIGGVIKVGSGTQILPLPTINSNFPILTLNNPTAPVIQTTGGTLTIGGGYVSPTSGAILVTSNTPISLTGSSVLTLNGANNTFGINYTSLGAGTLTLAAGTVPSLRVNTLQTVNVNATVGATLNSLPNVISSVTGVSARILQGTLSVDSTISFLYLPAVANLVGAPLDLHFANGVHDKFVLQLSYNPQQAAPLGDEANLYLGWFDPVSNTWKKAVEANSDGGSSTRFVQGAYNASTDFNLGTYGVDTTNHTVWAVIDHNSTFGVANSEAAPAVPTPEPSTAILTVLSGCGLLLARRRKRS